MESPKTVDNDRDLRAQPAHFASAEFLALPNDVYIGGAVALI